jgi:acylphosphatase
VQGVGFRATVRWIAGGFETTGWVRNLPDGRVELLAQGDASEVKEFILAIRESQLAGHIKSVIEEKAAPDPALRGFVVA